LIPARQPCAQAERRANLGLARRRAVGGQALDVLDMLGGNGVPPQAERSFNDQALDAVYAGLVHRSSDRPPCRRPHAPRHHRRAPLHRALPPAKALGRPATGPRNY
jgi:hypothetical protein